MNFFSRKSGNSSTAAPAAVHSGSYRRSSAKAADYIRDKNKLTGLIDSASAKANVKQRGLRHAWHSLLALLRLVRAYVNGSYRDVTPKALLMIVAAVIYFVSPIDLIPDFILGLGLVDDATVLAWTIRLCADDIARFVHWETQSASQSSSSHLGDTSAR